MVCRLVVKNRALKKVFEKEAVLEELASNSVTTCSNLSAALSSQNWNIKIQTNINVLLYTTF